MLEKMVKEAATTDSAASIAFATKKDRSLRFGVDYWNLNDFMIRDSYPLFALANASTAWMKQRCFQYWALIQVIDE